MPSAGRRRDREVPMTSQTVRLTVNGRTYTRTVEPRTTLADFLRDDLDLTGTHVGCEHGVCGACTVLLDGQPVRSCLLFAIQLDGTVLTTVEGPADGGRLNQRISSSLDYDEPLTAIARAASEIMAVPSVSVWVADAETSTVTVRAFSDNRLGSGFDPKPIAFGEHGIGWVALHRKPLHVPDIHAPDSPVGQREWFRARDLHSAYAVPILFQDQILGVLSLTRTTPFDLDDDDTELLDSLVAQAAVAIRNARLFAGSETRRRTAEALADLLRLLSQTLEVETVAQRIAEDVRDLLHVGAASVYHLEPETDDLVVIASSVAPDSGFDWALVMPRGYGTGGIAVQKKVPITSPDVLAQPRIAYSAGARA